MNARAQDHKGVLPEDLLAGLPDVEWPCKSGQAIVGNHHQANLYGYLNPLRPIPICLITKTELEWIFAQPEQTLLASPAFDPETVKLVILCADCKPNPAMISVCSDRNIAIATTQVSSNEALDYLQSNVPKLIALRGIQHGVFLAVIEIYRGEQSALIGECPRALKGYIEIRGLGIINILKMFGPSSVLDSYRLQLVIDLRDATNSEVQKVDRLAPSLRQWEMLGIIVPCLTMLVAPGRNLSVLVEAAVRDHLLRIAGVDSSAEFLEAHDQGLGISPSGNG
jgi:serine kinase of HPr protein (carbohydrate metabolism regulator)